MPAQNGTFTNFQKPRRPQGKKPINVVERNFSEIVLIPDEREERTRKKYLHGIFFGLACLLAVILAGILPALIITLTKSSTSNTANDGSNAGGSVVGNNNATTLSSVTSVSSSFSTNSNTNTAVTTGVITATTTGVNTATATGVITATTTGVVTATATGVNTATSTGATIPSAYGFTAGGAVLSSTTQWFGYEEVTVSNSVDLTNITIIIIVQKTVNATYLSNSFSTFWSGVVNSAPSYVDTGLQIIYTWAINSGQTVAASGSPYRAQAQFNLFGTNQTTSADTYSVTATTVGGLTSTVSGHF